LGFADRRAAPLIQIETLRKEKFRVFPDAAPHWT
jgi:hypothetical protein